MLAEPGEAFESATFALFECELPEDFPASEEVEPVPDHLAELLDSAKAYPRHPQHHRMVEQPFRFRSVTIETFSNARPHVVNKH